ncbi:hypothetical protein RJT34_22196 [Clitoria ternatea]|uniref:TIR domain-containing protein n=1 Tax=Clitoria ternatea TaxID=43366 RepID=A0AAN9IV04_CLITE
MLNEVPMSSGEAEKGEFFKPIQVPSNVERIDNPDNAILKYIETILMEEEPGERMYEVFLSFRGEDTRASFVSHLYASLQQAGITVYKDDQSLPRGDHISDSLLQAIERSQISVIVFSTNYAGSGWCMEELEKIMECHRTTGQAVLPVFYDVDPSEVRHQTGKFGEALENLSERLSVERKVVISWWNDHVLRLNWKKTLREAAGIAGIVALNSRNESEVIKNVVENVTRMLNKTDLFVASNPVGVESRVQNIIQLLDIQQSNNVLLLGIWGMGGVGKTTIAKAVYNEIGRKFEGRSYLAHIREVWEQDASQVSLQERLLFDIYRNMNTNIQSIESGQNILKERLCHRKVLLVLDDVSKLDQLNALCGAREWFGPGSRIVVTTRDEHILKVLRVDHVYRMKEMNETESIELFSWHAFKQANPRDDFVTLSRNVVEYSGGLPLALEVLGSYLFERDLTEWKSTLEKLKKIPNCQVQKKLKISFDGLEDDMEKEIFLDIACFFIGMDRGDVTHILNGCGLYAEIGISILVERSLVTVDGKNKLGMHDLLRDMGREIIREESPKEPEERSRLWFHEDVLDVLLKQIGTKSIQGLVLKLNSNAQCLRTKAFKKMRRLRLLHLAGVELHGDFGYLSKDLRWLCWHGCPLTCVPTNFYQGNLVSIEIKNSKIKLVWEEAQMMMNLKILNLSHSHYLKQTPDFSKLPNLEKLILIDCPRLCEVSNTIGHLKKILLINLEGCINLRTLPRSIYKLKSLRTLILSGCLSVDKLEEDIEQMESLTTLIADNTAITRVPFSVVRSKSIGYISLCGYQGFARDVFPSIIWSWMSPTNSLSSVGQTSANKSSLVSLNITRSYSHNISSILEDVSKLQSLWVECGSEHQLSQEVARILDALYATNFGELESIATSSQVPYTKTSTLFECISPVHRAASENSLKYFLIHVGMNCPATNTLKDSILQGMMEQCSDCLLPGDNYPNWLTFNNKGSSVVFDVPHVNGCNLKAVICIVHHSAPDNITPHALKNMLVLNHTKTIIQLYKQDALASFNDEEGQRFVTSMEPGNKVEVVVVSGNRFTVKKTIVYLIYDESIDNGMGQCLELDKNVSASSGDENVSAVRGIFSPVECLGDFKQKEKRRKFE